MKLYEFHVHVAVPDNCDESALLEQFHYFVAELCGDAVSEPQMRSQAKAVLHNVTTAGGDAADTPTWTEQACGVVQKHDPLDLFTDMRGRVERRRAM